MTGITTPPSELELAWRTYHEHGNNMSSAARSLGIPRQTLHSRLQRAIEVIGVEVTKTHVGGSVEGNVARPLPLPPKGKTKRYLLSCGQSNTLLTPHWNTFMTFAETLDAEILISRFTYNKLSYGERSVKPGGEASEEDHQSVWYAPEVDYFSSDEMLQLAPGLVWCGHLQVIPTAELPLSGFENYCARQSIVVPHPNIALQSVPSAKMLDPKLMYTTGSITQKNYIQMKTGQKAENRHRYGGLLVEVDHDGSWWCRQVEIGSDGSMQDLNIWVKENQVEYRNVKAIVYGDIHAARIDEEVFESTWGPGGIADTLKPEVQVLHDILDFHSRSHHEMKDPHKMFSKHLSGQESVEEELLHTAAVLCDIANREADTVVVSSNHDRHLDRWLKECDYRYDPVNAMVFLELQHEKYRRILHQLEDDVLPWALLNRGAPESLRFLDRDESYVVAGVELGMHGDDGPNGRRGNVNLFSKQGRPTVTMHAHGCAIRDGSYQGGTSSKLDMGYNHGQSSWSHSHVLVYENGSRAIMTLWKGRWRGAT